MKRATCFAACLFTIALPAAAQEMEPKAYSASPVGARFLVAAGSRSTGSIVFDPSLPIEDASARINGIATGVGATFDAFGKLALVSAVVPFAWGDASGRVGEESRTVTRAGLADLRAKFSINLRGNDAMRPAEFAKAPRRTIIGTSITIAAPTGQYDGARLINLGNNRWAFKPEFGIAVPRGAWDVDAYLGVWLFTPNSDFYPGGLRRTQDAIIAAQGHVSYSFKPRLWLAVDATWYSGGGASVDGGAPIGEVNNARMGATVSLPFGRSQSFKVSYSSGVSVRSGTNFRTLAAGWQKIWLRP
jgi:hypothetical protein